MGYLESLCRLGIGLALCLIWVTFSASAQADAISESPFMLDPPTGWKRDVLDNGVVSFVDPKNEYCAVFIKPHISTLGSEDESWWRNQFNRDSDTLIKQLTASGGTFLNQVDRSILERIADRIYIIRGSFLLKWANTEEHVSKISLLALVRRESAQELVSAADSSACNDHVSGDFFNKAIANIERINTNAQEKPLSPLELRFKAYRICITHCLSMFVICNFPVAVDPRNPRDCGEEKRVCDANCGSPPVR